MLADTRRSESLGRGVLVADVGVRMCRAEDLPSLEWFGLFAHQREIFHAAFARHLLGENIMLVADLDSFPIGQASVDLVKGQREGVGYLWALRVFPLLRGHGVGTLLIESAEQLMQAHGLGVAEVGVDKDNVDARRLYERLGYGLHAELCEQSASPTPDGVHEWQVVEQWILRKPLPTSASGGGD